MSLSAKPPPAASDIPEEWPQIVREIIQRNGQPIRGDTAKPRIEVKSMTDNLWRPLMLPGGGVDFVSFADRNIILHRIQEGK